MTEGTAGAPAVDVVHPRWTDEDDDLFMGDDDSAGGAGGGAGGGGAAEPAPAEENDEEDAIEGSDDDDDEGFSLRLPKRTGSSSPLKDRLSMGDADQRPTKSAKTAALKVTGGAGGGGSSAAAAGPASRADFRGPDNKKKQRIRFTKEEENALRSGHSTYNGALNMWAAILDKYKTVFHPSRTSVDLKDKWRNMNK